ncbi:ferredoxin [Streptomyces sp. NPDC059255]|uniref:ferredoxin n=1 Tax=Streptomyces sp. NPDC059255 TaxID=3346793 RepID=UPI00367898B7
MSTELRIVADRARCVGAGQCVLTAPELFDQSDDDGTVVVLVDEVGEDDLDKVREAVHLCPSGALALEAREAGPLSATGGAAGRSGA